MATPDAPPSPPTPAPQDERDHALASVPRRDLLRSTAALSCVALALGRLTACTADRQVTAAAPLPAAGPDAGPEPGAMDMMAGNDPPPMAAGPGAAPTTANPPRASTRAPATNTGARADQDNDAGSAEPMTTATTEQSATGASEPLVKPACAVATHFPEITDLGPIAGFTRMDRGDELEWLTVGIAASLYALQLPDCVLFMLRALDGLRLGYPISMLQHSLQAATRAHNANASDELVLCALCHHLGALLSVEAQAELSASILRGFVSEDAYRIVRHGPEYQWQQYGAQLGLPTNQRARYAQQSWHADAVRFSDEWDSPAYDPSFKSLPLEEFESLVRAKFSPDTGYLTGYLTSTDCI